MRKYTKKERQLPQEPLPAAPEDDYTAPVKRYIVDYTTGMVLDEVESTSTVAGMVGSGLVGKFLERAAQFPDHYLALATSAQLPGPPLGVSEAEYPNLYLFKLATHNWEKIIQPYVEFADSRGYYVDAHASGKQLYMDAMGINMAYVGPESLNHARALRNQMNEHSTIQAHRVTVQKGRPEDIMSPEQLAQFEADGGTVVRKEEYTPNVTPELLAGAQVHSGDNPPFNPEVEFTYSPVIYIEGDKTNE